MTPRPSAAPSPALPAEPQCPLSTLLAVSASLLVAAAPLPSSLCALLPADIPASLSLRVSNEEVIADPGLTAHALLGALPEFREVEHGGRSLCERGGRHPALPERPGRAPLAVARGSSGARQPGPALPGCAPPASAPRQPLRPRGVSVAGRGGDPLGLAPLHPRGPQRLESLFSSNPLPSPSV